MTNPSEPTVARPLSGTARLALIGSTAATIALFYLFITVSLLGLLAWIGFMLLIALALARFGASGIVTKYMERDFRVLGIVGRRLWLSESAAYRLPLQRADAPRLFALVENLAAKFAIPPPDELCIEMTAGAWVQLRGLKSGLGTTRIGVGYDLLAGLSEREVEAVMAHELAHAKLIGRAFHNWLSGGLSRAAGISNGLSAAAETARRSHETLGLGNWILHGSDALTRLCAQQMGAYSRQSEFEADREAARLCGAAALRAALERLDAIDSRLARLPWDERVGQIESAEGLSPWLQRELAGATAATETSAVFDRYSTHPPQRDRLAALQDDGSILSPSQSGLSLLAEPNALALKLVAVIEQVALREERKDLRELRKWLNSVRRNRHYRAAQFPGMLVFCFALVAGAVGVFSGEIWLGLAILLGGMPLGYWLTTLGRYRDRHSLPVPDYVTFLHARQNLPADLEAAQKLIEEEFKPLRTLHPKARKNAARLAEEAYAALGRADYLRAHVAARLAGNLNPNSLERNLAMMVSAAAFHQTELTDGMIGATLKETSWYSPSTTWAAAWTMLLSGNWRAAEALLHDTLKSRPDEPNLRSILGLVQSRRGKRRSAIQTIRAVCTPRAPSPAQLKLLVELLLDTGALNEASERLREFGPEAAADPEVTDLRIRWHLLHREFEQADQLIATFTLAELTGSRLLNLGFLYEGVRAEKHAEDYFRRALGLGHFPAAHLGLARLASGARDKALARHHILAALDTTRPPGVGAATAYDVFPGALNQLFSLEEPDANCRAWIANFATVESANPLANRSLFIFAPTPDTAEKHLRDLAQSMKPDLPSLATSRVLVEMASADLQPARPVRPGVQYVYR